MSHLVYLALGGAAGTLARYGVSHFANRLTWTTFPLGTFTVNALGSLLFGVVTAMVSTRLHWSPTVKLVLLTGFMGAFTTFSTYAHESANLMREGQWFTFGLHMIGHNVLGLVLVLLGLLIGSWLS